MEINECSGLDLYADDGDAAFVDDYNKEAVDIYDDIISIPTIADESSSPANISASKRSEASLETRQNRLEPQATEVVGRRHQLYIGNLTWWTKDQDIVDLILEIGIKDCIEVKFFENRINGQSKGYCVISLKTEQSARACLDQLPLKELHGRKPMVTNPTKQALNLFESNSKTRPMPQGNMNRHSYNVGAPIYAPVQRYPPPMVTPAIMPQALPLANASHMMPPPSVLFPPRITTAARPLFSASSRVDMRNARPDWNRTLPRYPHYAAVQPAFAYDQTRAPPPAITKSLDIRIATLNQPAVPGSSANHSPANSHHSPNTASPDSYVQALLPPDWTEASKMYDATDEAHAHYNDAIFEKILSNNRKISSTAIARAVSDTASGDYRSAVDTLSTALSLIRQSHAAEDDRCKILMSSLQDTLYGVEAKAYRSRRSRTRDRHYDSQDSPDRNRSRSYVRERSYFEGSRRSEYYREEYEEKSRKRSRFNSDDDDNRSSRSMSVFNANKRGSYHDYSRKDERDMDRRYYERERERSVRRSRQ